MHLNLREISDSVTKHMYAGCIQLMKEMHIYLPEVVEDESNKCDGVSET
jgi:hypothetical protein